jgi:hypothetical protein
MEIQNKELGYRIFMEAGENIKILINDNEALNMTVSTGKEAKVNFKFQEALLPEV